LKTAQTCEVAIENKSKYWDEEAFLLKKVLPETDSCLSPALYAVFW